jgi:hypothetical protein
MLYSLLFTLLFAEIKLQTYYVDFNANIPESYCDCFVLPKKYPIETFRELQKNVNDPLLAFLYIKETIKFIPNNDVINVGCMEYWSSALETLGTGFGDCEDGAILFYALLSDNPEFDVKIITLFDRGHVIATYKYKNKIGVVSFNNNSRGRSFENSNIYLQNYDSVEEALFLLGGSVEYALIPLTEHEAIFGLEKKYRTCGLRSKFKGIKVPIIKLGN